MATVVTLRERTGMVAGIVCAVHCGLVGAAYAFLQLPAFRFLLSPLFDWSFFALALVLGSWSVWDGIKKHGKHALAALFATSIGLFGYRFALDAQHGCQSCSGHGHEWISITAGAMLVAFHGLNHFFLHKIKA